MTINQTSILTIIECFLVSIVAPGLLAWMKYSFAERTSVKNGKKDKKKEEENSRIDYLMLEFDYRTLERYVNNSHIVYQSICSRFDKELEINKFDIEAIRNEMAKQPERKTTT